MSIISGITCKNGTSLVLSAPVSVDGTVVTIYNPGGNYAYLSGNLNVQGTTVLNGTSYIYDHNLVVQGAGIVIEPSLVQAASGLYIKNIANGPNQAYIDSTTGTIGCRGGVYVQNSAGTALGYIDSYGSIYSTTIGGQGGLFVVNSANSPLGWIDSTGSIHTKSGLFVQNPAGTTMASIDNAGNLNVVAANVGSLSAATISVDGLMNFTNQAPQSPNLPLTGNALTNKTYVDTLVTGGYASLTANQTFTGLNQFSNTITRFGLYNANPALNTLTEFSSNAPITAINPDATNPNRSLQFGSFAKMWGQISLNCDFALTLNGTTNQIYNSLQVNIGTLITGAINLSATNIAQYYNFQIISGTANVIIPEPAGDKVGLVVTFRRYISSGGNIIIYTPLSLSSGVHVFLPLNSVTPTDRLNTAGIYSLMLICDGTYWIWYN